MKAIICTKYGSPDVLELREVVKPIPKDHEVLINVHATTVTSGDCRVRGFRSPLLFWIPMRIVLGFTKPRNPILGVELAGEVVTVGSRVTRFKKGDRIFAMTGMHFGAYAEYICLSEDAVMAHIPDNTTYAEASAVSFGGTTSLHFLRKGQIRSGQKVAVYGASGSVGTSAVQLAKHFGAEVTGICSADNIELVKSLGADKVIDYTKRNFAELGETYDLIFDAVGKSSKADCLKALTPGGKFVTVEGQGVAKEKVEDMLLIKKLLETGQLKSVIDRRYPLENIREAHRYVEQGHKKGNVVITVS
ncbi:NAD(P)-dependent alcohol dehydrogenase [Paenibacillus harenae]|uniref:NADPH:quinone reductase-like Zn-dependent oxidoreductase n=1 Tax=Paenibacillus harenae TaxID=306543 RepID=A0ABT9U3F5_PAEHA|nr:NAD(P)-dependent alcohol dehydrogenase [Paenibacillus harenae]MDQ0058699.1 NADPH:quinone reductase-like Zn-dependent oxidoreductase [Paenibacillus harenae]MDQ0114169.1 NADPH:quinone reductase-like Zn-dependent oxidoreductase [Paenibacillus harenae]